MTPLTHWDDMDRTLLSRVLSDPATLTDLTEASGYAPGVVKGLLHGYEVAGLVTRKHGLTSRYEITEDGLSRLREVTEVVWLVDEATTNRGAFAIGDVISFRTTDWKAA